MRLYSPQLAMPNLQPRSFEPVANVDTQREGAKTVKVKPLKSSQVNSLVNRIEPVVEAKMTDSSVVVALKNGKKVSFPVTTTIKEIEAELRRRIANVSRLDAHI